MGKFRVKPARSVGKPFKKVSNVESSSSSKSKHAATNTNGIDAITQIPVVTLTSASKISKRTQHHRASALKKPTIEFASSPKSSPKKSVTFASPSSNTIHVLGTTKKESIRAILKDGAGALVNLVSGGVKNFKRKGLMSDKYSVDKSTVANNPSTNSLNKVLKNQFKDKRTRRKLRKEAFHKKLSLIKESETETKAEKRRKCTVIVGDMQPIADILAELEQEVKASSEPKTPVAPPPTKKPRLTLKKREQEMLDALKFFEAAGM